MAAGANITPEFRSECRIRHAARCYWVNIRALQAGRITVDEHRAENRRIKADLTEGEWNIAKGRALSQVPAL